MGQKERKEGKGGGGGGRGECMCNAQFKAVLLKDKPQFRSPSLKSAGHRHCPVERRFVVTKGRAEIPVCVHVVEIREDTCGTTHWSVKRGLVTFRAKISVELETLWQVSCNLS